jgi:MarR family transcriptional regulator, transcriptional regulator for hemolysin
MECIIVFLGMYCQGKPMKIPPQLLGSGVQSLSIAYQQLAARLNRQLEPLDLNMTQISLLTHLIRADREETVLSLSQSMQMNQPMVTKAVQAMEARGWIDKKKSVADARVSFLKVTKAGQAQLQHAQQVCVPVLQQAFGGLDQEELTQLIELLQKLNRTAW